MIGSTPNATARPALVGSAGLYVTGDDHLLVTSLNSLASVVLEIGGRQLLVDGRVQPIARTHTPNTDRTSATTLISLAAGWMQNVTVRVSSAAPIVGQTYVRVDLVRGDNTGRTTLATLLAGYVTAQNRRAWPGSKLESSLEGPGAIRSITGTDPSAGTDFSETVPTGARWRLLTLTARLVNDATAANREAVLLFDDGTTVYARYASGTAQTASQNRDYTWSAHGYRGPGGAGEDIAVGIASIAARAGHRIRGSTVAQQAGDNWGAPQLLVEEWLEGAA